MAYINLTLSRYKVYSTCIPIITSKMFMHLNSNWGLYQHLQLQRKDNSVLFVSLWSKNIMLCTNLWSCTVFKGYYYYFPEGCSAWQCWVLLDLFHSTHNHNKWPLHRLRHFGARVWHTVVKVKSLVSNCWSLRTRQSFVWEVFAGLPSSMTLNADLELDHFCCQLIPARARATSTYRWAHKLQSHAKLCKRSTSLLPTVSWQLD